MVTEGAQGKKGSKRHFDISGDDFITPSQVFWCVLIWEMLLTGLGRSMSARHKEGGFNVTMHHPLAHSNDDQVSRALQVGFA